jgi:hypothetical protein
LTSLTVPLFCAITEFKKCLDRLLRADRWASSSK